MWKRPWLVGNRIYSFIVKENPGMQNIICTFSTDDNIPNSKPRKLRCNHLTARRQSYYYIYVYRNRVPSVRTMVVVIYARCSASPFTIYVYMYISTHPHTRHILYAYTIYIHRNQN